MFLLVPVEAEKNRRRTRTAISLQSLIIKEDNCQAGNLLKIYLNGGRGQARCDGERRTDLKTSKSLYKRS